MHSALRISLVATALSTASAAAAQTIHYDGSFTEATSTGAPCDAVFAVTDYGSRLALAGPTRRTAVVRFDAKDDTDGGHAAAFFDGLTLTGLLGGSNDLYYEKDLARDGQAYALVAEGFASYDVLYLDFKVTAEGDGGQPLCEATATYSGFSSPH